jgi:hypothetical protein
MASGHRPLYDLLFGDVPMDRWPPDDRRTGPVWDEFLDARRRWAQGDQFGATTLWKHVAAMKDIEARHIAQAWNCLRLAGVKPPPAEARRLLGVVLEVPVNPALDILACYEDGSAYYLNHAGRTVIWSRPDARLDPAIAAVMAAAREVVAKTGPWGKPRLDLPPMGHARVNMITPGGLHFGQAPSDALFKDPMGGPLLAAGAALMQEMMAIDTAKE